MGQGTKLALKCGAREQKCSGSVHERLLNTPERQPCSAGTFLKLLLFRSLGLHIDVA